MEKYKSTLMFVAMMSVMFAWIPLSIVAFYVSPIRADIKLTIAASISFSVLVVWLLKEG